MITYIVFLVDGNNIEHIASSNRPLPDVKLPNVKGKQYRKIEATITDDNFIKSKEILNNVEILNNNIVLKSGTSLPNLENVADRV